MKFLTILGFLALSLVAAGLIYFFSLDREFPLVRTLTNEDGRTLEVTILGKESGVLTVERHADGTRFDIEIETLSLKDRLLSLRLPDHAAPPPPEPETPPPPTDPYIAERERLIAELTARAAAYKREIKSGSLSDILHRNRIRQLADVEKEIAELRGAIEAHRYRTKAE